MTETKKPAKKTVKKSVKQEISQIQRIKKKAKKQLSEEELKKKEEDEKLQLANAIVMLRNMNRKNRRKMAKLMKMPKQFIPRFTLKESLKITGDMIRAATEVKRIGVEGTVPTTPKIEENVNKE